MDIRTIQGQRILILALDKRCWAYAQELYADLEAQLSETKKTEFDFQAYPFYRPLEAGQEIRPEQFFPVDRIFVFGYDAAVLTKVMGWCGVTDAGLCFMIWT